MWKGLQNLKYEGQLCKLGVYFNGHFLKFPQKYFPRVLFGSFIGFQTLYFKLFLICVFACSSDNLKKMTLAAVTQIWRFKAQNRDTQPRRSVDRLYVFRSLILHHVPQKEPILPKKIV